MTRSNKKFIDIARIISEIIYEQYSCHSLVKAMNLNLFSPDSYYKPNTHGLKRVITISRT